MPYIVVDITKAGQAGPLSGTLRVTHPTQVGTSYIQRTCSRGQPDDFTALILLLPGLVGVGCPANCTGSRLQHLEVCLSCSLLIETVSGVRVCSRHLLPNKPSEGVCHIDPSEIYLVLPYCRTFVCKSPRLRDRAVFFMAYGFRLRPIRSHRGHTSVGILPKPHTCLPRVDLHMQPKSTRGFRGAFISVASF